MSAEAERVRDGGADAGLARLVRDVVEIAFGVGCVVVDGRRQHAFVDRERAEDRLDGAGGAETVAGGCGCRKTHYDASGNPVKVFARSSPGGFLETYSANGKEISARSTAVAHLDLATNTLVGTGNQRHFIVPGISIVYAQAGRFVIAFPDGGIVSRGVHKLNPSRGGFVFAEQAPRRSCRRTRSR